MITRCLRVMSLSRCTSTDSLSAGQDMTGHDRTGQDRLLQSHCASVAILLVVLCFGFQHLWPPWLRLHLQLHAEARTITQIRITFEGADGTPGSITVSPSHMILKLTSSVAVGATSASMATCECDRLLWPPTARSCRTQQAGFRRLNALCTSTRCLMPRQCGTQTLSDT